MSCHREEHSSKEGRTFLKYRVFLAAIWVSFALGPFSLGADWPRWRGPEATGHVPKGAAVLKVLPAEPTVVWKGPIGAGLGSPVVALGRVFYLDNQGDKEMVHAVEADTGKALWSVPVDEVFKDSQSDPGPRSTPLVDDGRVYALSCRGEFQCLDADDGKVLWRVNFVTDLGAVFEGETGAAAGASRHGYTGSPFVEGDRMFVDVGGRTGASVVCFNKKTGSVIWKSESDIAGQGGIIVSPLAGVEQAVSFTASDVIGLSVDDGKLLWRVPVKTRYGRHCITPMVADDRVMVSSYQDGLIGIRVARDKEFFVADRAWTNKNMAINFASAVVIKDHLYGLAQARKLICVDIRTGDPAWAEDWTSSKTFGVGHASFIAMGDRILVLSEDGSLLLMDADPKRLNIIGTVNACGRNWCNPAYADGRLFLRDEKELLCLKLTE